jgi:hypothetical protein
MSIEMNARNVINYPLAEPIACDHGIIKPFPDVPQVGNDY